MIGLAVLAGIAIYIAVWWLLVSSLKRTWAKAAAIVIALAIPFWDFPIGYYNFERHCSAEGGLRVVSKFPPSDSILLDQSTGYRPEDLVRYGFKTIEYRTKNGAIERFTLESRKFSKTLDSAPKSTIKVLFVGHKTLAWHLIQSEMVAQRVGDGQIVARHNTFLWAGVWWQAAAAPFFGYGARCGETDAPLVSTVAHGSPS